jgi:hypothetical protein
MGLVSDVGLEKRTPCSMKRNFRRARGTVVEFQALRFIRSRAHPSTIRWRLARRAVHVYV